MTAHAIAIDPLDSAEPASAQRVEPASAQRASTGVTEHVVIDSPIGPLTLVAADGSLTGLYMADQRHRPADGVTGQPGDPAAEPFAAAAAQLAAYFAGRLTEFTLPLAPAGTPFQREVWAALRQIPYGGTWSYGQLARRIGKPTAVRAVGMANGRNPIALVIPCHRVIGANGSLTGYGGGLERKRFLLDLESKPRLPTRRR